MSRTVPSGSARQQIEKIAPSERSDTGPAALIAIRRRRGSNHASLVSTYAYGQDHDELQPRLLDVPPERGHRQPVRGLVHGDDREAAEQEHEPADPDLARDHERRPVAQRDQRREHADARDAQRADQPQRRAREQHPAAVAVERVEARAEPVEHLLARREQPAPEAPASPRAASVPATPARNPRSPRSASSRASRAGPGRAEALLGLADQVDERARAVDQLEQLRVVVGQPQVAVAREVAQDPAPRALLGVEPLERIARPHARPHAELRRLGGDARACRPRRRPATRPGAPRSCRPASAASRRRSTPISWSPIRIRAPSRSASGPVEARAVDERAVARAGVLDPRPAAVAGARSARAGARRSGRRAAASPPARGRS